MSELFQPSVSTLPVDQWLAELDTELKDNILGFWMKFAVDEEQGGFIGEMSRDLTVIPQAAKSLVLNTRILWTFSAAYRLLGNQQYLSMANRAFAYLAEQFFDKKYGGYYWMLNADGSPLERKKQIYGQSFAIYAFAEYYRATGNQQALQFAIDTFLLIEQYGHDPEYGGYIEALSEDWKETKDLSLSGKDLNEKKSMNTHLHVMEAYTNLYRVWKSTHLEQQLAELINITIEQIIDQQSGHFKLFFNEQWESQSNHISYGHDIEGSWLLVEAAEVLGNPQILAKAKSIALKMADAVLVKGYDEDGGLFNEAENSVIIDDHKDWWPQAEAVVGFYNAYQLTGNQQYRQAAERSWRFIQRYIVDKQYGEWYWSVLRNGTPSDRLEKISAWKCPYHNSRACFEMIERLTYNEKRGK